MIQEHFKNNVFEQFSRMGTKHCYNLLTLVKVEFATIMVTLDMERSLSNK